MLRLPNPGSDISSFIRIFQVLFDDLKEQPTFNLDDMTRILIKRNLATSSGHMGSAALQLSYNADRSRDPLFNQSKSYSELFRLLGWFQPTAESALTFQFTFLGAHVAAAKRDPDAIVRECILGIAYPNALLGVKGQYVLRPFVTMLRAMNELDGLLCRDEMIVGPLCLENDRDIDQFNAMIAELKSIRRGWAYLKAKIQAVSQKRGISETTMGNYTRFPIGVMQWTDWTRREVRKDYYGKATPFLVLTDEGKQQIQKLHSWQDIRAADIQSADDQTAAAIIRIAFYQMLERADFEIDTLRDQIALDWTQAARSLGSVPKSLLFSPFQELKPESVNHLFPKVSGTKAESTTRLNPLAPTVILPQLVSEVSLAKAAIQTKFEASDEVIELFQQAFTQVGNDLNKIADHIASQYQKSNKGEFYPLIVSLFCALGYNCELSRHGVNAQRYDAIIIDSQQSIPIEIKSPGEEQFLSMKAIRQALENKIILLSRISHTTQPSTTSLVVGYNFPNDRSEVASLIADIHKAFDIILGVIDFRSLLILVAATILQGRPHNADALRNLHGLIKVRDS